MADTATVTPPKKSKRDTLLEKMRAKYPDKKFDDDEELYGQVYDDYDDYDQKLASSREREGKLSKLFSQSPKAARMLQDWAGGKDPVIAFVEMFGSDIADAVNDPTKRDDIATANKQYLERMTQSEQYEQQYDKNLDESIDAVNTVQKEDGLSDEETDKVLVKLGQIVGDGVMGKFTPETIRMVRKAMNHDTDVATAAEEAEVRGRNARIDETLRKNNRSDGVPAMAGKNATQRPETQPLGALDRYGDDTSDIYTRGGFTRTKR